MRTDLVEVPGGPWSFWRWSCLRGTGFPTSMITRLGAADARDAADAAIAAEERATAARRAAVSRMLACKDDPRVKKALRLAQKGRVPEDTGTEVDDAIRAFRTASAEAAAASTAFAGVFATARARGTEALREVARDARFREAVTWQNRSAVSKAIDPFVRGSSEPTRSKERQHEALVVRYLQRYCTKNDTIGFFGPVGWATWDADQPRAVAVDLGDDFLAARSVYFEQWAIDALAARLTNDPRFHRWMTPRRLPFVTIDGGVADSAVSGRHALDPVRLSLLAACDGVRTAGELASTGNFGGEDDVFAALADLRERKLVAWAYEVPLSWNPERRLRSLVERVGDDALRAEALVALDDLEAARARVAKAAGDVAALGAALDELDRTFVSHTGAAASQQSGTTYAGRQVVFEDTRRGVRVTLGKDLLAVLGPPLSIVLASARWFAGEVAEAYRAALRQTFVELAKRKGTDLVPFLEFWLRSQRVLFGKKDRPVDVVVAELERRWASILELPPGVRHVRLASDDLRARVTDAFPATGAPWRSARLHSPDFLVAAESADAIARGDFILVLGEIHPAINTLDCAFFVAEHPHPPDLHAAFERAVPAPRIMTVFPKDWPRVTVRTHHVLGAAASSFLETGFDPANAPRDRVVASSDLHVADVEGRLVVRGPRLAPMDVMEIIGEALATSVLPSFRLLAPGAHTPRVSIDRLVVVREQWSVLPSELDFATHDDDAAAFLALRRWASSRAMPRFVFVKAETETKPLYVDLESPHLVAMFAKVVRAAATSPAKEAPIVITEMTPGLEQAWLPDRSGNRYAAEIRVVAVDREPSA